MKAWKIVNWTGRLLLLLVLFIVIFVIGTIPISGVMPDIQSEPGLLPDPYGFLVFGFGNMLLIAGLILTSRWSGWKLALIMSLAYYGAVTFLTQIETWFFMSNVTADEQLLPLLFVMGLPIAFIYIPLAVWILGKGKKSEAVEPVTFSGFTVTQWTVKLIAIIVAYITLYWSAGYFIAWQNPSLRAFYGSPGDIVPFWEHTANTLATDPGLFPFQALRALLWALCALPIIAGSKVNGWQTAIFVGLFFTLPQVSGLILENPLMPEASVRFSHLIEGLSSNFIFGMIIAWLLHRDHESIGDLFGIKNKTASG